jgi:hypothetical protein
VTNAEVPKRRDDGCSRKDAPLPGVLQGGSGQLPKPSTGTAVALELELRLRRTDVKPGAFTCPALGH